MQFAAEMDYCGPRGIPWEEFLGWSKRSRDAAIVWQLRQQQTCGSCHTRPEEWDPDRGGDYHAYEPGLSHCRGCEIRDPAVKDFEKSRAGHRVGTTVVLRRAMEV